MDRIVQKYSWKDMDKALHDMHGGSIIKAVLVFKDE